MPAKVLDVQSFFFGFATTFSPRSAAEPVDH
jgi:hypothetical protein